MKSCRSSFASGRSVAAAGGSLIIPYILSPPFSPSTAIGSLRSRSKTTDANPPFLSSLVRKLSGRKETSQALPELEEEPEPVPLARESPVELQAFLPANLDVPHEAFEQFLLNLSMCREPIAFELVGAGKKIITQFSSSATDALSCDGNWKPTSPKQYFSLETARWRTPGMHLRVTKRLLSNSGWSGSSCSRWQAASLTLSSALLVRFPNWDRTNWPFSRSCSSQSKTLGLRASLAQSRMTTASHSS